MSCGVHYGFDATKTRVINGDDWVAIVRRDLRDGREYVSYAKGDHSVPNEVRARQLYAHGVRFRMPDRPITDEIVRAMINLRIATGGTTR